ncbi:MAG: hypothetical protein QOG62_1556 [Thermoleophilaceae bacterium]|nr:hypothetical protein [Thermoleophilaceae bacterium]
MRGRSNAGFYLTIDEKGTDEDMFYAHLKKRSNVAGSKEVRPMTPLPNLKRWDKFS